MPVKNIACLLVSLYFLPTLVFAQKADYLQYIEAAAESGWAAYPQVIAEWKANVNPSELWGYNAPSQPVYLADILGFLYRETGERRYAQRAATLLTDYGDLRNAYPDDYQTTRAEYASGMPALSNFFFLPAYSRAYLRIRGSGVLDEAARAKIERDLAHSLDFVFHFPEWGAHNRAILRAEALYYGYLAMPDHPSAARWQQMAEVIASDNLGEWEIEDASHYNAIWLRSLFAYADLAGQEAIFEQPFLPYYAEYYKQLFTPAHTMPDFGDAAWNPAWNYYVAVFERFATEYQDPELKWIAARLFDNMVTEASQPGVGVAWLLALAYDWADEALVPQQPDTRSQEVLDDVIGKKVVFRSGWDPDDTYLLLNYRDEGEGGFAHREFLRHTISVEEEKMHHGHSDENGIALLMDGGSVLLHEGGYRDDLPSGPYGQFRADYFHNRLVVRKDKRDRYQSVPAFIHNSGAYRPVRTQKIDFLSLDAVDMSRTRLYDDHLGYAWDRIVTYVKDPGFFLVIDAVNIKQTDYFTFTNLWHTQTIHEQGNHRYLTSIDSIGSVVLPQNKQLQIHFLETYAKADSFYTEQRHYQQEQAIYQTQSSHYLAGSYEVFVTALVPQEVGADPASLPQFTLLKPEQYPEAIGIEIVHGGERAILGVKLDLEAERARENIRPRYTWERGRTSYGDFETDAHFFFATLSGDSLQYAASQVLKVLYKDRVLMEALPNTHGLQLDGEPPRVGYVKWRYWEDTVDATP